ncbi:PAS domain S-box protein [Streptomyces lunaelactis]|uniref:PAS domain-containing sensor histidine kinase n=1 Tax=Streptomyces lunaelactis TaxID=1535768 RepID=UPI001585B6C7|nr:PAS domain S-box protein [Streptomyces lunaelactis]NUK09620.1 PAS domain S-box protein [Streptomyces lunaelactis]NUL13820.1 PAS domain S-box protein [Streptomyces lunaelactis]NUL23666.1 PAS domain S-box protein [Streptomyces lunaelactis]
MEPEPKAPPQERPEAEEERFRLLLKNSPDMVFRRSVCGTYLDVSAGSWALLGYPCEEVVGTSVADLVHPGDMDASAAAERDLANAGRAVARLRLWHSDGRWVWTESTAWVVRNDRGKPIEVRGFTREVEGPQQAEEALWALQEQARSIIDTARDAFVRIDEQGVIIDWNQSAENLFGWTRQEVLGRPLVEIIIPERYRAAHLAGLERVLAGGEPHVLGRQIEISALHRDGHELSVELGVWRLESGPVRGFNAFVRDITERRRAEQALLLETERRHLLAETIRSREQERTWLAAELHDGPIQRLTSVGYGFEEACLVLDHKGVEASRDLFARARTRLGEEIGGLRTLMTVLRPPALDAQGLAVALQDLADEFGRQHGVHCPVTMSISQRLEPNIETVIYRIVQEALTNVARHAHATNAAVTLADSVPGAGSGSASTPGSEAEAGAGAASGADHSSDNTVVLTVADDGVGFDTTRTPGFVADGHFGMSSMRERVRIASGTYALTSSPGAGTRIEVRIPVGRNQQAAGEKEEQP